jgi:catechol 2,3-dioxygenase-like lactoylglutathione lyase family enzyme
MMKRAVPVIHVTDVTAAEEFYCRRLGFTLVASWRADQTVANPAYLTVERDGVQLHLTSFKDGTVGTWTSNVYIFVDDVDGVLAEIRGRGVAVNGPFDQSWGTREFGVRDADRNNISFGQRRS